MYRLICAALLISLLRLFSVSVSGCVSLGLNFSGSSPAAMACFPGTTFCHQKSLSARYIMAQYSGSLSTLYIALPCSTV